jgi:hypothetical protein
MVVAKTQKTEEPQPAEAAVPVVEAWPHSLRVVQVADSFYD